jgi:two-component system phosphate regulon response regulator OmpR
MPGEDGLSLARFLRERGDVGIIMLATSADVIDRIVGLEMGADVYLVMAVLRRAKAAEGGAPREDGAIAGVPFGDCRLDLESHKLHGADGVEIPITAMEFDLLKAFANHPRRVLSRDQLLSLAHNRDWEPFDYSIDIRIARIRRKIERDPAKPRIIKTVLDAGYMFETGDDKNVEAGRIER